MPPSSGLFATTKIKSFSLFFSSLLSLLHPAPVAPFIPTVTILCYHTFDAKQHTPFSIDSARFNEQMRYLSIQKIPVISLRALTEHLQKGSLLPERSVVITIDDGYKTAKTIAWPILARYQFPFTLYVYPHAISRLGGSLTWDDLRMLASNGVEIESHSLTHPLLTHPGKAMAKKDYADWIDEELRESKRRIEKELGLPVTSLAYPYGGYDEFIVDRARAAGYVTATTCDDGDVGRSTDPLRLNRRLVFRNTTKKAFAKYFRGRPLELVDLSPKDGERVKDIPREISARVVGLKDIRPETAQILVDKLGGHWHPISIDPITGMFRLAVPRTASRRGYYFASIVAQDRCDSSIQREASWLFIIRRNISKK